MCIGRAWVVRGSCCGDAGVVRGSPSARRTHARKTPGDGAKVDRKTPGDGAKVDRKTPGDGAIVDRETPGKCVRLAFGSPDTRLTHQRCRGAASRAATSHHQTSETDILRPRKRISSDLGNGYPQTSEMDIRILDCSHAGKIPSTPGKSRPKTT